MVCAVERQADGWGAAWAASLATAFLVVWVVLLLASGPGMLFLPLTPHLVEFLHRAGHGCGQLE